MLPAKTICTTIGLLFLSLGTPSLASEPLTEEPALPGLPEILPQLRAGGFVVYFRHAASDLSGPMDEDADMARCETQRNLSAAGRDQATRIGQAWRALGIPVDQVLSSPFCRCKDTARLAFGHYQTHADLYFSIGVDKDQKARSAASLRQLLGTPPKSGSNTVIVAHTANLREASGIWPNPEGVAYVFKVTLGGKYRVVARIAPQDWLAADLARPHTASLR